MKIKIPWAKPLFFGKEKEYVVDALESTWISGGRYVEKFEKLFETLNKAKYGITTSNGTTALHLALLALGIKTGDEVIVPGFSFAAPANMVIAVGARPVFAEIDPLTWCLDHTSVEKSITDKTKVIIAVHTYGNVCNMGSLKTIAKRYNLAIIEDVAEASFSKYKKEFAGTIGDIGCFSFQATKTITMGEGGFCMTNSKHLYQKMQLFRNHGMRREKHYWHEVVGFNFRLTNLQAAVGYAQLEEVKKAIAARRNIYLLYRKHLIDEHGITMQYFPTEVEPVVWAMGIKINARMFKGNRDFLIRSLAEKGIETRPGFYTFSSMPPYHSPKLPVCENVSKNVICLPFFPQLSEEEINFICTHLKKLKR